MPSKTLSGTFAALPLLVCLLWLPLAAKGQERPNIILIVADDLGFGDVGFNESTFPTPHIDDLASGGMVLNRFYVAPVCSPTRAGLMTGRYPDRFGLRETVIPPWRDFGVDTSEVFMPEILGNAGYQHRAMIGKWHLGHSRKEYHPMSRGFTHFYGHFNGAIDYFTHKREGELDWHNDYESSHDQGYATDLLADEAVSCIQKYKGDAPFFIYLAFNAPHSPLQAKKEDLIACGFDPGKPRFSHQKDYGREGRGNTKEQTYHAMVMALDRGIGKVMKALDEEGIADNTIVIFHSDNGPAPAYAGSSGGLRGHKFQEWEGGVRVPALVYWENHIKAGKRSEQVMGYIDILPTLADIVGLEVGFPNALDGRSMRTIWNGQKDTIERNFYLGCGAAVNHRWKLVLESGGNPTMNVKEDVLFDLWNDPTEAKNRSNEMGEAFQNLNSWIKAFESINPPMEVPPYHIGKEGFQAPKEWNIYDF
ncbi:arylsulfatase [Echinicola soli]|uniref:Arylsulfatase n=1 Tax=Echinicola soli TaxID=2591634 RepID=A0A514CMJ9_9BACT|nr:arylsulfatase [Echinicola soli]QDH81049.1 arylsulfatase [Echinicola soli]